MQLQQIRNTPTDLEIKVTMLRNIVIALQRGEDVGDSQCPQVTVQLLP